MSALCHVAIGAPEPRSPYERLGELLQEAAEICQRLASQQENQVAAGAQQSDITCVKLLAVSDLAKRFSVTQKTIRRWRREGLLPSAIEIGGVIRWRPEVVDAWIQERSA